MVATSLAFRDESHLDRGIYDVVEVAVLTHQPRSRIERWVAQSVVHGTPEFGDHFSFLDLVSIWTVSELRSRGVTETAIAEGRQYLTEALATPWPFAHEKLATVGRHFFADLGGREGWIDVGLGGQQAFDALVANDLQLIDYGTTHLAIRWRPASHISLDPSVQAGSPCVLGTRVPSAVLAGLVLSGQPIDEVADDFRMSAEQVTAAVRFEESLSTP